ncbi:MAG: lasso peptide biosynthesis B2 protein [Gaiellaceae bacterium]
MPDPTTTARELEEPRRDRPFSEKVGIALEIALIYPRVRWLLLRRGLRGAVASLRGEDLVDASAASDPAQQVAAQRLGDVVRRVLEPFPFDSRCLMRSLVLTAMLARRGIFASVVVGVRTEPAFEAHAWVESGGVALLPSLGFGRVVEV